MKRASSRNRLLPDVAFILVLVMAGISPAGCRRNTGAKVLVLGVDGATYDLMLPWVKSGKLPHFAALLQDSASGDLRSTVPPLSAPAWTTAVTGVNPGKHGVFAWVREMRWKDEHPVPRAFFTSRDRKAPAVWQILSEANRRVVVLNVPCTSPPEKVNGCMISGFPFLSREHWTYPDSFRPEVADWPMREELFSLDLREGIEHARAKQAIAVERSKVALRLLKDKPWDLFWIVFTVTDSVQHRFWRHMDPKHPLHDENTSQDCANAILNSYITMDNILGNIISGLDRQTTLIVLSDHGFGPLYHMVNGNSFLRDHLAGSKVQVRAGHIETGSFRLGDPGLTADASAREQAKDRLVRQLKAFRHPLTGQPVVEAVYTRDQVYRGPYAYMAPDVIACAAPGYHIFNGFAPGEEGSQEWNRLCRSLSGYHRPNGVLIMTGARVRKGVRVRGAGLADITPTILYLLGETVPAYMDGRVLTEAIAPSYLSRQPPPPAPKDHRRGVRTAGVGPDNS